MIVVMKKDASAREISNVISRVKDDGYNPHLSEGDERTIIGLVGESPTPLREDNYSSMPGVDTRHAGFRALQARQPRVSPAPDAGRAQRLEGGGEQSAGDRRTLLGREPRADHRDRLRRQRSGRDRFARRGVQAALVALQLSGAWRGGAEVARRSARSHRAADCHRSDGAGLGGDGRRIRRRAPNRRAQHAELPAAQRRRRKPADGAAQARHGEHDGRPAHVGGVHARARQQPRHALRARHPHLREVHPQHLRHQRHSGAESAHAPAGHRRSEPRGRLLRARHGDCARRRWLPERMA